MSLIIYERTTRGSSLVCRWESEIIIASASYTLYMLEYVTARNIPVTGFIDVNVDLPKYDQKKLEVSVVSDERMTAFQETCDYRLELCVACDYVARIQLVLVFQHISVY